MKKQSNIGPLIPSPSISRVILYVKEIEKVASFYETFFGMRRVDSEETGWLELESPSGGCTVALHQASKSQRGGAAVKLVFGVKDVQAFKELVAARGLKFGPVHTVRNVSRHEFANGKILPVTRFPFPAAELKDSNTAFALSRAAISKSRCTSNLCRLSCEYRIRPL